MKPFSLLCLFFLMISYIASDKISLDDIILEQDKKFFSAFNVCDVKTMAEMFSKDLEFYHDKVGLSGYQSTMEATQRNCDSGLGLERTLLEDATEIHAIGEFGAMQKGKHRFCHMNNEQLDCGVFSFVHLWKKDGDKWFIHRVLSYDH